MTQHADKRAHLDLQINLLAEQELTAILSAALDQGRATLANSADPLRGAEHVEQGLEPAQSNTAAQRQSVRRA